MISRETYINMKENTCESLLFIGDIHGEFGEIRNNCRLYPNTIQFYCGDVGMGFYKPLYYDTEFKKISEKAVKNNCIIVLVRGNHDDPSYYYNSHENWDANKYSNVWWAQDWQLFETRFGNVLCSGGAVSVDRFLRKEGKTWWSGEKIDYQPLEDIFNKIGDKRIDIMVTHTSPKSFPPFINKSLGYDDHNDMIYEECEYERKYLDKLKDYLKEHFNNPIYWFYGHFHNHYNHVSGNIHAYGLDINEVKEVIQEN